MIGKAAAETEIIGALAMYCWYDTVEVLLLNGALNSIDTLGCRAPFEILSIVDVGPGEELSIAIELLTNEGKSQHSR